MARSENEKGLLAYVKALQDLLACYRLDRRPSEALFGRLERGEELVRKLNEDNASA